MEPISGIITKGLGLPAANNIIVNFFNLTLELSESPPVEPPYVPPPVYTGGGGGGAIYPHSSYTVSTPDPVIRPFVRKTKMINVRVKIRNNEIEKVYQIPEKYNNVVINIFSIINKTQNSISVAINNIRQISSKIQITINKIIRNK